MCAHAVTPFGDDARYFEERIDLPRLVADAWSPDFWRSLCPHLTVSDDGRGAAGAGTGLEGFDAPRLVEQVVEDGYFQTPPLIPPACTQALASAVSTVTAAGYHPLFATVYDEFWQLLGVLNGVLAPMLGAGGRVIPDFWVWHVSPQAECSGWAPHRDNQFENTLRADGRPALITVWLPLTDATPLNSCMYVVPLSRDPHYPGHVECMTVDRLQDIRALPTPAGSILGWNQFILHWGSRSSREASGPRISWGIYVQSADVPPFAPLTHALGEVPDFHSRLAYIGENLARYRREFPLPFELTAFVLRTRRYLAAARAAPA